MKYKMNNENETKKQLIKEVERLRQKIKKLEKSETERKQAEEALRMSEERYRKMFESMGNAVAIYEAADNGEDFIFRDFNNAAESIEKVKRKDIIGKSVLKVFPGVKDFGLFEIFQRVWRSGRHEHFPVSLYKDNRIAGWRENYVYKLPSGEIVAIYEDVTERKQAEEKLKEYADKLEGMVAERTEELQKAQERFSGLYDSSKDAIKFSALDGTLIDVNDSFSRLTGYAKEELLAGRKYQDITPKEYHEYEAKFIERVVRIGKPQEYEKEYIKKDGSRVPVLLTVFMVKGADGKPIGVAAIIKDISERKQAEKKTERLTRVLHAIRNINQLIARGKSRNRLLQGVCDILAETRFYFNIWIALFDKSGKLLTSASTGMGENFLTMVEQLKHGDLPECGRKTMKESKVVVTEDPASTCTDCPLSKDYANRGAMTVNLGYEEKIYGLLCISSTPEISTNKEEQRLIKEVADDIAFGLHSIELEERRKRGEEELRESEEKYRNLFESSLDGIISTDMQGNILDINQAYLDMLGFSKEEIKKLTFQQLTPEKWLKNDEDIIKNQIIPRGYSDEYEKENIKKDGSVFPISIRVWLIKDENGKPVGMWRFVRDITKLKQMQERLVRQEKLAILGQLAGGVAHELRNPLGAIKNAAYFLNMVMEKPEPEVKESLQILEREVGTSERIISSLLEFARPKSPTRRKIDINSVIQETLSRVHVPQNINVVNQLENTLPIILADPDQLNQVFTNIILNAIQSMPEGGDLLVRSEVESPEWMTVSFTDSGIGIPKDSLPKIFEPLFTTKAKGIGLGLAVTKTLIEGQGGTIQAQSEVGKGSTFAVKMPISKKEEE
jgi:PAS domain S-box-containing protein